MVVAALLILTIALAWPVPRVMARLTTFRRAPRAALVVWQSTSVAAVLAALFAAPPRCPTSSGRLLSWPATPPRSPSPWRSPDSSPDGSCCPGTGWGCGCAPTAVGTAGSSTCWPCRRTRTPPMPRTCGSSSTRPHGLLRPGGAPAGTHPGDARCPAGGGAAAVRTSVHTCERHDLILEFFTVVHEAVPAFVRSDAALRGDPAHRGARTVRGPAERARRRAIVGMAGGGKPRAPRRDSPSAAPAPRPAHPGRSPNAASRSGEPDRHLCRSIVAMPVAPARLRQGQG